MTIHKVLSANAIDEHTLLIEFDNHQLKKYDVTPWLDKPAFSPLKNPTFFKSVQVEKGGYAVHWNSEIDLSEYELWRHGVQAN